MSRTPDAQTRRKKRRGRTALKIAGICLLGLLFLAGAALLWLRTDSAARFAADKLTALLAKEGLVLELKEVRGPLPGHLSIGGSSLSDAYGPIVKAGRLELSLDLSALLAKRIHVTALSVDAPEVFRLTPVESATGNEGRPEDEKAFSLADLPRISVANLRIRDGVLRKTALSEAVGISNDVRFEVNGSAGLEKALLTSDLHAFLSYGNPADDGGAGSGEAKLDLFTGQGGTHAADDLEINLEAREGNGGILSLLAAEPNLPAYSFSLRGKGPMEDWRGTLRLDLWQATASPPDLGSLTADLSLSAPKGSWQGLVLRPEHVNSSITLSAVAAPGPLAPEELRAWLGKTARLSADVTLKPAEYAGSLNIKTEVCEISAEDLRYKPPLNATDPLRLTGRARAALTDTFLLPAARPYLGAEASLTADFNLESGKSLFIQASGDLEAKPAIAGESAPSGAQTHKLAYTLDLEHNPERLNLKSLSLTGMGVALKGGGALDFGSRKAASQTKDSPESLSGATADANLELKVDDLGSLEFVGLTPAANNAPAVSGPFTLTLSAKGNVGKLDADLNFSSPGLKFSDGSPHGISLRGIKIAILGREAGFAGPIHIPGSLIMNVEDGPAGAMALRADWDVLQEAAHLRAAVKSLRLNGAGLDLTGDLQAEAEAGEFKGAEGSLRLQVDDWAKLSALSGLTLHGEKGSADLRLSTPDGLQKASLTIRVDDLALLESAPAPTSRASVSRTPASKAPAAAATAAQETLRLHSLELELDLADLDYKNPSGKERLNLQLKGGPGSVGHSPPITWTGIRADAGGSLNLGAYSITVKGQGKTSGPTGETLAREVEKLAVQGGYDTKKLEFALKTLKLNLPELQTGLALKAPVTVKASDGLAVKDLRLDLSPGGELTADLAASPAGLKLKADLNKLPLRLIGALSGVDLPEGAISAHLDCSRKSPAAALSGQVSLLAAFGAASSATSSAKAAAATPSPPSDPGQTARRSKTPLELNLKGDFTAAPNAASLLKGSGTLRNQDGSDGRGDLSFSLPLQLTASGLPVPATTRPVQAAFTWKGSVAPLWGLASAPLNLADRFLSGRAELDLNLSGALDAPKARAAVYMANGRYADRVLGIYLTDIALEARGDERGDIKARLKAGDGRGGTAALDGSLDFSAPTPEINLRGQINRLRPLQRDDLSIMLSGIASLKGPLAAPRIEADIEVERGELTLSSALGASVSTLDVQYADSASTPTPEPPQEYPQEHSQEGALGVHINIPRQFYIRGMGLESEWKGDLRIAGPLSAPSLTGSLSPVRGYFDILSKTFNISSGDIVFAGGGRINPSVNLELTYESASLTAVVKATGTAQKPKLTLDSRPVVPQDEILAQVLFGKNVSQLSRVEMLQLANGVRELASIGEKGFNPMANMRKTLGLDVLRLGSLPNDTQRQNINDIGPASGGRAMGMPGQNGPSSDQDAGPSIEAGKYITDRIYVGVAQGTGEDSTGVRVEVELFPNVRLEGRSTSQSSGLGLGWKKDY